MKAVIMFFLAFAIVGVAEEKPATQEKRLTSVTWDVQTRKLAWVVQTGQAGKDGFLPSAEEHYEVSPNEAVMTVPGQKRAFTAQEATWVGNLLHVLTGYCIASTFWWYREQVHPPADSEPTPPSPTTTPPPITPPSGPAGPKPAQTPDGGPVKVKEVEPNKSTPLLIQPVGQRFGFPTSDSLSQNQE